MKRIKDYVKHVDINSLPKELTKLAEALRRESTDVEGRFGRTDASVAISRLGIRSAFEIQRIARHCGPVATEPEIVAWSTRNIFEMNLILRHVMNDLVNLKRWVAQVVNDRKEVAEGLIGLSDNTAQKSVLESGMRHDAAILSRHGIAPSRRFNIEKLAKDYGLESEYAAMFKLCSKIVHPSSWLVNLDELADPVFLNAFVIMAQVYALDSMHRLQTWDGKVNEFSPTVSS